MLKKYWKEVIIIGLVFIALGIFYVLSINNKNDAYAYVHHKDELILEIDLSKINNTTTYDVMGSYSTLYLECQKNQIRVKDVEETCPNKICINYGYVSNGVIICAPNEIMIKVVQKNSLVDA